MKNRKIYAGLLLFLLYCSSAGNYMGYEATYDNAMGLALFDIVVISFIMMIVPFIIRMKNKELLNYEKAKKICMYNSLILFGISIFTTIAFEGFNFIGGLGAVLYYFINMFLFSYPKGYLNNNDKKENDIKEPIQVNEKEAREINLSDPNEVVIRDRSNTFNTYSEDVRIHKETDKKYCTKCGKSIENEWAFCNHCGNKLK